VYYLIKDYKMILIMPENLSQERRDAMVAYGAELILVSEATGMEGARDLADTMEKEGGTVFYRTRRIVTLKLKQNNIRRIRVSIYNIGVEKRPLKPMKKKVANDSPFYSP
jgi:hypothetical protein